ncbi:MAG: adenylyltransferase/cytidyltransferase family protein [Candidatus Daviesbacteria bacterium]|nr:adenylyltransferase/cytidyltransferase family protein [Candidatus Daviesbacteria bacterium]
MGEVVSKGKKIVLVGGCFDVLHPGHVVFLEKAKKEGDILVVLLECDKKVRQLKGISRPVHNQKERAKVLSALRSVDCVVMLPFMHKEEEYDAIIQKIKPKVIAATSGDCANKFKQRSAKLVKAKLKYVTRLIGNHSSSKILTNKD